MAKHKKRSIWGFLLSTKVIVLVGLIFLGLVSFALSKELMRKHRVNQEIEEVKKEITSLEKKNKELAALIEYLNTDSYKEIQARQNLNLQKEGETAVAVMPVERSLEEASGTEKFDIPVDEESSNVKKWWNYFFNKKTN